MDAIEGPGPHLHRPKGHGSSFKLESMNNAFLPGDSGVDPREARLTIRDCLPFCLFAGLKCRRPKFSFLPDCSLVYKMRSGVTPDIQRLYNPHLNLNHVPNSRIPSIFHAQLLAVRMALLVQPCSGDSLFFSNRRMWTASTSREG